MYRTKAHGWVDFFDGVLAEPVEGNSESDLHGSATARSLERAELREIANVILWDYTLIAAKISRAVSGQLRRERIELPGSEDADGSAKVALICMDRSINAWWRLRGHVPGRKREIAELLARLGRLREATERMFPEAREFVRPGFDEP